MYVQLKELNEIIEKKGVVENFKQGKQQFIREQPAVKAYNALIKNYNITIKQLSEFLLQETQFQWMTNLSDLNKEEINELYKRIL